MSVHDEVTHWVSKLQDGDSQAAQSLWERYFQKLVGFARGRLRDVPRRASDEEDVALSAFNSFFRGAAAGRYPKLDDRDDLWKVLVTITARKATALKRRHFADKRGGGHVRGESYFQGHGEDDRDCGIEDVLGDEPTPEMAAIFAETCSELLEQLDDDVLRNIAILKMEGFTNDEIARRLDCASRTVERKLRRIRRQWHPEQRE